MTIVRGFVAALATLALLDGFWLGLIARKFYRQSLGGRLRDKPIWAAVILFYVVQAAGIVVFPANLAGDSASWAALYGAAFGLCLYAAYDLSNLATLRDWPIALTVVDLAWGAALTAAATATAVLIMR